MCQRGWVGSVLLVLRLLGGVLGGSWLPALWWGCPTVPSWRSPSKQDTWLMTLLETMTSPATKVGSALRRVLPWGPASPGAKQDQAGVQRGRGQHASLMAAGVRAVNAAWGLLQRPRSPREEKVPVNPAWPFGDRAQGWGKFWDVIFSSGKWYGSGGAPGALLALQLLCYALLSPSPLFQTLFPLTWRSGGHSNFWPKSKTAHKRGRKVWVWCFFF